MTMRSAVGGERVRVRWQVFGRLRDEGIFDILMLEGQRQPIKNADAGPSRAAES